MKAKFVSGQLEHQVEKFVNKVMRDEKNLLTKYSEGRRSIEDILFKDEVSLRANASASNRCGRDPQNQGHQVDCTLHEIHRHSSRANK